MLLQNSSGFAYCNPQRYKIRLPVRLLLNRCYFWISFSFILCSKLALKCHPDAGSSADTQLFIAITEAVEILSDQHKRLEYDRKISDGTWASVAASVTPASSAYNPHSQAASGKVVDPRHFNKDIWNYYHYGDPLPKREQFNVHPEHAIKKNRGQRAAPRSQRVMTDQDIKEFHRSVNEEVQCKIDKKNMEKSKGSCAVM